MIQSICHPSTLSMAFILCRIIPTVQKISPNKKKIFGPPRQHHALLAVPPVTFIAKNVILPEGHAFFPPCKLLTGLVLIDHTRRSRCQVAPAVRAFYRKTTGRSASLLQSIKPERDRGDLTKSTGLDLDVSVQGYFKNSRDAMPRVFAPWGLRRRR